MNEVVKSGDKMLYYVEFIISTILMRQDNSTKSKISNLNQIKSNSKINLTKTSTSRNSTENKIK
jgi:precorrin-6B methylase 1